MSRIKAWPLLLMLFAPIACGLLRAQSFEVLDGNLRVASLDGLWRFHTGDDPAWADPKFDDSEWALLRSDEGWSSQGFKDYAGVAWYRFVVTLPPGVEDASISLPHIFTCYEVYANGRLIGGMGKMPPDPAPDSTGADRIYSIPRAVVTGRQVEIAIRVWEFPGWAYYNVGGPESGGGLIGETIEMENLHAQGRALLHWSLTGLLILNLMKTMGAAAAVVLFLLRRREREYLWFALIMAFGAAAGWILMSYTFTVWSSTLANQTMDVLSWACVPLAQLAFYRRLLDTRRSPFYWFSLVCLLIILISPVFLHPGYNIKIYQYNVGFSLLALPSYFWILWVVFAKAWQNVVDARLLVIPAALQTVATLLNQFSKVNHLMGREHSNWNIQLLSSLNIQLSSKPFPISQTQVADLLFLLAVLGILIYRFTRTSGQEERFASEIAAARNVQQYLIPDHLPETPGLTIESVYSPAREVGGDFFQVLPDAADDSVLIVLGDVAGHGMEAGMLATLMVGGIRMAEIFTTDPERILSLLNKRMRGRGLATCIALRIERDGNATLANAGHLAPYLNGEELAMEGALPLGAIAGITFPLLRFKLSDGDQLMLMTDGIAEAQDADGTLFGFERIGGMLRKGMGGSALATAAQGFGQEDDITVLTVARKGSIA
jgi:hypothetical protein